MHCSHSNPVCWMWVPGGGCKGTENDCESVRHSKKIIVQKINLPLQRFRLLVGKELFKVHQVPDSGCLQELKVPTHFPCSSSLARMDTRVPATTDALGNLLRQGDRSKHTQFLLH